jgi:hypothetical protein
MTSVAKAAMSLQDVRDELLGLLPKRYVPSISKLSRMETGKVPEAEADGMVINALSQVYKCKVSDLSPTVADEMERVRELLVRSSPWNTTPSTDRTDLVSLHA